jgi:hypothetical protein
MLQQGIKAVLFATALAAGSAGALIATETAGRAQSGQTLAAAVSKSDRLDSASVIGAYTRDRIDRAFAIAESGQRGTIKTDAGPAEACMPDCSSVVYKSEGAGNPSRIVPGSPGL